MEVQFRAKNAPDVIFTFSSDYDIEQMRKHSEYEEVLSEKEEPKKIGRPKKTELGEE
jgi:hypothetical protein